MNLLETLVRNKIDECVINKNVFSTWSIIQSIRDAFKGVGSGTPLSIDVVETDNAVKRWYADEGKRLDWCRTTISTSTQKAIFVYHPLTVNAECYPGIVS